MVSCSRRTRQSLRPNSSASEKRARPWCAKAPGPEAIPDPLDLTGEWEGTFTYPGGDATTPFFARILENSGRFAGSIIEPDLYAPSNPITAEIVGNRDARSVDFTKIYIHPEEGYEHPVDYVGQLSPDGLTVSGMWSLVDMNGTFEMYRDAGMTEVEEAETAETVPAPAERS